MRQSLTLSDEPHLMIRSLAIDYHADSREDGHSHVWPQFLYARSGAITAELEGRLWTVPPRRGLWIPSGVRHRLRMSSRLQLRTLYFAPEFGGERRAVAAYSVSGLLHEAILRVCELGALDRRRPEDQALCSVIVGELQQDDATVIRLVQPSDQRARRLVGHFLDPQSAEAGLAELYALCGLGRRTAERIFLAETGLPPAQWRRLAALSRSLVEIAGGEPIEYVALGAGYQSRSAFSEAFVRTFGFTPGAVRLA